MSGDISDSRSGSRNSYRFCQGGEPGSAVQPSSPSSAVHPKPGATHREPPAMSSEATGEDAEIIQQFLQDFLLMLDERTARIQQHLDDGDDSGAVVAQLSLETSSQMAHADELVRTTRELRQSVASGAADVAARLCLMLSAADTAKRLLPPAV